MRRLLLATLLAWILVPGIAGAQPRLKHVTLAKHTTMQLDVVPDLGVRFVFPFVLDEQDEYVPFTLNITNPAFVSARQPGRNSFVVTVNPEVARGTLYSNMFVTVAGYEITIQLRTTTDLSKHFSDVVFQLGKEAREELIQQGVKQRTKALEKQYQEKLAAVEAQADKRALARVGVLALAKPESSAIKEEGTLTIDGGDRFVLYVDKSLSYGPYTSFVFHLENKGYTSPIAINDAKLFSVDAKTKQARPIDAAIELPPRLNPRTEGRGVLTAITSTIPSDRSALQLHIATDKGSVFVQW